MQTENVPITEVMADPANVRTHPERNIETIKASLARFGQQKPIVVDSSGVVRAGNGTLDAAKALGWESIDIVRTDLEGSEATAYAIADNRTSELAEWDDAELAVTLDALKATDADLLAAAGYSDKELEDLLAEFVLTPEIEEDEIPEVPDEPITQPGDLWILGEHRVLCGDSTKAEDVARLMDGATAECLISDPPYGMNYAGTAGTAQAGMANEQRREVTPIIGDEIEFDPTNTLQLCDGEVLLWGGDWYYSKLPSGGSWLVWDKRASEAADATPGAPFEVCWSRTRQERRFIRVPWGGWINKEPSEGTRWHPTQKPIKVMAACVEKTAGLILDPFLGSGTTLIAAEQLGRKCYGMEISPAYCDVIVKRWENLTGKTAERLQEAVA